MNQQQLIEPGPSVALPSRRREGDRYYSPLEATAALIEHFPEIQGVRLIDPCCGDTRMARQLLQAGRFEVAILNDIDPQSPCPLHKDACDLEMWQRAGADACVTNPPWTAAGEIAWTALQHVPIVALLLRVTWGEPCDASPKAPRNGRRWLTRRPPQAELKMDRISISYDGVGVDSAPSSWFIWGVKPRIMVVDLAEVGQLGLGGVP